MKILFKNNEEKKNFYISIFFLLLVLILFFSILLSLSIGAFSIPFEFILKSILNKFKIKFFELDSFLDAVFFEIRLPRILIVLITGSGLAISGVAIQALFRNPLVESGIIGISSGAALFSAISIIFQKELFLLVPIENFPFIQVSAFIGSMVAVSIVYILSINEGKVSSITLILSGIAINALFGAMLGFLIYLANDSQLRDITFWSLGGFGRTNWNSLTKIFPFWLISIIIIPLFHKELDAISLGESEARNLGVSVERAKLILIAFICILVASLVSISGIIGFIGLIVPHLIRLITGPSNKFVFLFSFLLGSILLLISDLLARTIVSPAEIPIGVVTSLLGAPFFIWILQIQKNRGNL